MSTEKQEQRRKEIEIAAAEINLILKRNDIYINCDSWGPISVTDVEEPHYSVRL